MQTILISTTPGSMAPTQRWLTLSSRISAALFGGYFCAWGFTTLVVAANLAIGGDFDEGLTLANMLAFVVFLGAFLWAFASNSLARVWLLLGGAGAAMTSIAWALQQSLGATH